MDYNKLFSKFYPSGYIILCGLIAIIYGAMVFIYIQQGMNQDKMNEKIASLTEIIAKPLSSISELREEYNAIQETLAPMEGIEAIEILVQIAEDSGIDITPEAGKFIVPSPSFSIQKIGTTRYNVIRFGNVIVQGRIENVKAFITNIEIGTTIPNIALTKMIVSESYTQATGEEYERIIEFQLVINAVEDMMGDNQLYFIHNPLNVSGGEATNMMGDDPETPYILEGFPDVSTTTRQKGYVGDEEPKTGYILYGHDKISVEDPTQYTTVDYIDILTTEYYYTCESNGQVRQWDSAQISTANEYTITETSITELKLTVDISIYTKPE